VPLAIRPNTWRLTETVEKACTDVSARARLGPQQGGCIESRSSSTSTWSRGAGARPSAGVLDLPGPAHGAAGGVNVVNTSSTNSGPEGSPYLQFAFPTMRAVIPTPEVVAHEVVRAWWAANSSAIRTTCSIRASSCIAGCGAGSGGRTRSRPIRCSGSSATDRKGSYALIQGTRQSRLNRLFARHALSRGSRSLNWAGSAGRS
jgi:hypothetical protein